MIYGLLNLPWWGELIALLILTHITIAAVTLYLHRSQAHCGVDFNPVINHFFRFWLWLTTGMNTKAWVAIHRKHHDKCETIEDPHSPQIYGLSKVVLEGAELYRASAKDKEMLDRYGRGTPDDWAEKNIYSRFGKSGIALMFILDVLLFGIHGIIIWAVQMIWIPFFAAGVINGIGHYWGYRNYECPDAARNIFPIAILIGGEELHNNHHTFPRSAKLSSKWWEFDIGWMYITLLKWFGLAKVHKIPAKLTQVCGKSTVDNETLKAIFANKFQIMSHYSKDVIVPVLKHEKQCADSASRQLFYRARKLLIQEQSLATETNKQRLARLLEQCTKLQLVYNYREKLQNIWMRTSVNQKELLESLQEWCKQAEATGIEVLQKFSMRLKTLAPK